MYIHIYDKVGLVLIYYLVLLLVGIYAYIIVIVYWHCYVHVCIDILSALYIS